MTAIYALKHVWVVADVIVKTDFPNRRSVVHTNDDGLQDYPAED